MKWISSLFCMILAWATMATADVMFDSAKQDFSQWKLYSGATLDKGTLILNQGGGSKTFPAKAGTWYRATLKVSPMPGKSIAGTALQLRSQPYPLKTYSESDYLKFNRVDQNGNCTIEMKLPKGANGLMVIVYTYATKNLQPKVDALRIESFTPDPNSCSPEQCMDMLGKYTLPQRDFCLNTTLVQNRQPQAAIVGDPKLAEIVNQAIQRKTGIRLPVLPADAYREKTALDRNLIMLGNRHDNPSINSLYVRHYTLLDVKYPGPGGHVVRSLHNPYADRHNVILAGGSDPQGTKQAAQTLANLIDKLPKAQELTLGHLKHIALSPTYKVPQDVKDMALYERSRSYRDEGYFGWNSLAKNLAAYYMTGEPRFAHEFYRLAFPKDKKTQDELFERDGEAYRDRSDPIVSIYHYMGSAMVLFWDLVEEDPIWTTEQRNRIIDAFYRQLTTFLTAKDYTRPYIHYHVMKPVNPDRHYTWQVLTAGITARYLHKYYPDCFDAQEGLRLVHNAMKPMMENFMAENISRFWFNTATELPAQYALLFGGEKYVGNPILKRYPRALLMLSALEPYADWSQNSTAGAVLHQYAYLTQDQAYNILFDVQHLESPNFTLGQSWYPGKVYPNNTLEEYKGVWQKHAVDLVGLKLRLQNPTYTPPPFPLEKVVNWMSLRTKANDSGDFMLLDTQYNLGLRSPLHQFSMLSAHLQGFPVLRGYFNSVENYADGLCDPKTVFFSEILNYGTCKDIHYITGIVRDRNGADWERTWLLRENQFILAVDTVTVKRDTMLTEINNHLTSRYPSEPEIMPSGDMTVTIYKGAKNWKEQKAKVGITKQFVFSCSADAQPQVVPVSSDAGSNSKGGLYAITRKNTRKGDKIRFATLIIPGKPAEKALTAQQDDTIALMTPEPAELTLTNKGFKLRMKDGMFELDDNQAEFVKLEDEGWFSRVKPDVEKVNALIAARKPMAAQPQTVKNGPENKPAFTKNMLAPVGVIITFQDKLAYAAENTIVILDQNGKQLKTITAQAKVGALAWEPQKKQLIAGLWNEKVVAYDLNGTKRWEYLSVMPPEILKLGPYWHKSAVPGIRIIHCAPWEKAAIFVGGCGAVEALTVDGKLVKNIYLRFGAVDRLVQVGKTLYLPHAFGGGPVVHTIDHNLKASALPCSNSLYEPSLGVYGFSSNGHAFFIPTPDGNWLDVVNGMHNRLILRDKNFTPQAELNFGPGKVAAARYFARPHTGINMNLRGVVCDGQNQVILVTSRSLIFFIDATDQKLKVKKVQQLPARPVFLQDLKPGISLLALEDGRFFTIKGSALTFLAQVKGEPLAATVFGDKLVIGDKEGQVTAFKLNLN